MTQGCAIGRGCLPPFGLRPVERRGCGGGGEALMATAIHQSPGPVLWRLRYQSQAAKLVVTTRGSAILTFKPHDIPFIIPTLPMGKLKPRRHTDRNFQKARLGHPPLMPGFGLRPILFQSPRLTHNVSWHQDATRYSLVSSVFMCHKSFLPDASLAQMLSLSSIYAVPQSAPGPE